MQQTITAGSIVSVIVNVIDDNGDHVAASLDSTTTRLQKGDSSDTTWNSVVPTIDEITTGVYRIKFDLGSTPVSVSDNSERVRVRINGTVDSVAFTEYHMPVTVLMADDSTQRLEKSAGQIITGTVDTVTNTHTPTTTEFQADDITEATADHYNSRVIIFTSGALAGQVTQISDYAAVGGIGQFTVTAMTEAPANDDTFIIV